MHNETKATITSGCMSENLLCNKPGVCDRIRGLVEYSAAIYKIAESIKAKIKGPEPNISDKDEAKLPDCIESDLTILNRFMDDIHIALNEINDKL
jgi:hypothetical protein